MPHPINLHGFQFSVLERVGTPEQVAQLAVDEEGRLATDVGFKDTVLLWPGETVKCAMDFSHGFEGEQIYMFHCHILEHETAMMLNLEWIAKQVVQYHHARMNAYSEDLHKKIVEALGRGATKSEAARSFGVSRSSVKRYAKLAEEGSPLAPKRRPGLKPKLGGTAERLLEGDLEERPTATLRQRREFLRQAAGGSGGGTPLGG